MALIIWHGARDGETAGRRCLVVLEYLHFGWRKAPCRACQAPSCGITSEGLIRGRLSLRTEIT